MLHGNVESLELFVQGFRAPAAAESSQEFFVESQWKAGQAHQPFVDCVKSVPEVLELVVGGTSSTFVAPPPRGHFVLGC